MQSQVDISMAKSIIESWQHSKDASTTSLGDDMDDELRLTLLLYLGKSNLSFTALLIFSEQTLCNDGRSSRSASPDSTSRYSMENALESTLILIIETKTMLDT